MKLTKQHIQQIDRYLKNNGVGYWDIRLEMVDHIACKLESNTGSYDFQSLFEDTIYKLGWDKNLEGYQNRRLKTINTTMRKAYFKTILDGFTTIKSLCVLLLFIALYYVVLQNFSSKMFGLVSITLVALPILVLTAHYSFTTVKQTKSGYLLYGHFYLIFSILMSSLFYQLPSPGGVFEVPLQTWHYIVFFTTIFNVVCISSGIKIYVETYKTYNAVYNKLNAF